MNAVLDVTDHSLSFNPLDPLVKLLNDLGVDSADAARVFLLIDMGLTSTVADEVIAAWLYSDNT